jgi:hypothetical protein
MKIAQIRIKKHLNTIKIEIHLNQTLGQIFIQGKINEKAKKIIIQRFNDIIYFPSLIVNGDFLFNFEEKPIIATEIITLVSSETLNKLARELGTFFKNLYLDYVRQADINVNVEINPKKKLMPIIEGV